jgi:hypothetical protein
MTPRQPYVITSRVFLLAAQDLLAQDDLLQAPKKGWGAAAQMVKAVADQKDGNITVMLTFSGP